MVLMGSSILAIFLTLRDQDFFNPNEKSGDIADENQEVTTLFTFTLPLYIFLGFVFKSSSRFMSRIADLPTEQLIIASAVFLFQIGLCFWICLGPLGFMKDALDLVSIDFSFRITIAAFSVGVVMVSFFYEQVIY